MDASGYNMSFDKEQLSVLCANYDRRIDTLANENAKLRKLIAEWYPHMKKRVGVDALWQWGHMTVIRELRVEESND